MILDTGLYPDTWILNWKSQNTLYVDSILSRICYNLPNQVSLLVQQQDELQRPVFSFMDEQLEVSQLPGISKYFLKREK